LTEETIPPLNIACYFNCKKSDVGVKLKCFASGAECIEGMPQTERLYRHIISRRDAAKSRFLGAGDEISRILGLCGINEKHKGYDYIKTSLHLCRRHPDLLNNITKHLYPEIARGFKTGAAAVERAIRNAVETSWSCGSEFYEVLFPNAGDKRPSNATFLRAVAEKLNQDI
ncbi:MAG: sporulation initiation factor Spo0A C-terminal domain-containing protein, partial [Firmicutes bacterium]|nr:sporulation initiation factor Spo0A C-terminal domain-containing protein [Bacillota bacterium]